jgi:hypothetical protein
MTLPAWSVFQQVIPAELITASLGILQAVAYIVPMALLGEMISKRECGTCD